MNFYSIRWYRNVVASINRQLLAKFNFLSQSNSCYLTKLNLSIQESKVCTSFLSSDSLARAGQAIFIWCQSRGYI